jgi:hypothetical protein
MIALGLREHLDIHGINPGGITWPEIAKRRL